MTTNMNFGPEWMRPGVPKRSSTFDSQNARPMHSLNHPSGVNGGLQSFMALNQPTLQPGFNDESISSISDHPSLNATNLGQLSESAFGASTENPYKYSKEFMLSLYRPVDPPADFERHEYVAVEESQGPLSFVELSEEEKKLLAGPVHSEVGRRMIISNNERSNGQRNNNNNNHRDLYASPLHSPASENAPGTPGRMNMARSKGRMHDYFTRDRDQQVPKRHDQDGSRQREWSQSDGLGTLTPNKSRDDEQEPPAWGSVSQEAVGSFDSNGVFRLGGGGNMTGLDTRRGDWQGDSDMSKRGASGFQGDDAFGSPLKGAHGVLGSMNGDLSSEAENGGTASMLNAKKPVSQYKWFYRDPQGTVQGPFEAQEMQEWYKAGFFAPTLLIRREDENQFEPLIVLIRRLGTDDEPFLTPFPSSHSATGSPSSLHMPSRSRTLDAFSRGPASAGSLMGLDPSAGAGGGFFGNSSQTSDLLSPQASGGAGTGLDFGGAKYNPLGGGGINNLSSNFLQQQMGQGAGSPHSPSLLQGPLNSFGSSLLGSRDSGSPWGDKPRTPSWLNSSGSQNDLFGGANDMSGMPPLFRQQQQQQQPSLNPLFGSNMGSPGLFDYQRAMNEQMSHQQYLQLLQQKQQQHLQFQQQLQQQLSQQHSLEAMLASQQSQAYQQQQQHAQQSPLAQSAFAPATSMGLESTIPSRAQASPAAAPGWGSAPGTPRGVGSVTAGEGSMSSSWLQGKASPIPASQTTTSIQTQENKVEPESTLDDIVTPMTNMQLKEEPKEQQYNTIKEPSAAPAKEVEPVAQTSPSKPASAPAVKPVSLREIQAEEMQKQQELKEQQQKLMQQQQQQQQQQQSQQAKAIQNGTGAKAGWNVSNNSPWGGVDQTPKGPSLREIQEMEAKEAESRKQFEAQQMAASTVSWTNTSKNPTIVSSASSSSPAWGATTAPKKTLREIQQEEEEAMKKKAKQQAAAAATASATSVNNIPTKGYAGIAGTTTPKSASSNGGSWTTVTNQRSAPKPAAPVSSVNNNVAPSATRQQNDGWEVVGAVKSAPISSTPASTRPATAAAAAARNAPKNDGDQKPPSDEFMRWCRQSLRGLNAGVNGDEILQMLLSFPLDNSSSEIIQDIIYANSTSMDGRRFSAEFMKRRKADMAGKLNVTIPMMSSAALDEEETFQVVTKKGKKKTQAF